MKEIELYTFQLASESARLESDSERETNVCPVSYVYRRLRRGMVQCRLESDRFTEGNKRASSFIRMRVEEWSNADWIVIGSQRETNVGPASYICEARNGAIQTRE